MIDKDVEIGEVVVDPAKSHVGAGRAPVDHEQPFDSGITEGGNEAVPDGKIGHDGSMQRQRRAQQGRNAAVGQRIVAQPDGMQIERYPARRSAFRLLRGTVAGGINGNSQKMRRDR